MKSSLTIRKLRQSIQNRRLLCERLEHRYAMHAMPWGTEWFDDDPLGRDSEDSSDVSGEFSESSLCNARHGGMKLGGLRAEAEASDSVTGNLTPNTISNFIQNGRPSFGASRDGVDSEPRHLGSFKSESLKPDVAQSVKEELAPAKNSIGATGAIALGLSTGNSMVSQLVESLVFKVNLTTNESAAQASKQLGATNTATNTGTTLTGVDSSASIVMQFMTGSSSSPRNDVAPANNGARNGSTAASKQTFDTSSTPSIAAGATRTGEVASTVNLVTQSTASYSSTRALSASTVTAVQPQLELSQRDSDSTESASSAQRSQRVSDGLRAIIESLAHRQAAQRTAAQRHSSESGWDDDLSIDAVARGYRDVVHDDGLLELATRPERMAGTSSQEAYAAIEQHHADQLSMTLVQVGMIREFDLAGQQLGSLDLIASPERMLTETTADAIAAVDSWHAQTQSETQVASEAIDHDNSIFSRSLLPASFLAVGGLLIASRRKYERRLNRPS